MIERQYVPFLHQLLMDVGSVSLKGLGTFRLVRHSASFAASKSELLPPSTSVILDNSEVKSNFATSLIEEGMDSELAIQLENQLLEDITLADKNVSTLDLSPIGILDDGLLVPGRHQYVNKYNGLVSVESTVLPHDVERAYVHQVKMAHEPLTIKQPAVYESTWKDYILPCLAVLTILGTIFMWYDSSKMLIPVAEMKNTYAQKPTIVRSSAPMTSDEILNQVDAMLDKKVQTPKAKPVEAKTPVPAIVKEVTPKQVSLKKVVKSDIAPKPSTKTVADKPVTGVKKTKPIRNPKPVVKEEIAASNDLTVNGQCIIIVGAFKDRKNANNLIEKLTKKGYETYVGNVKGLQRVGIAYDCQSKDPIDFRNEIRQSLNPQAWSLKDSL
jgi:cell division septation protein DedD